MHLASDMSIRSQEATAGVRVAAIYRAPVPHVLELKPAMHHRFYWRHRRLNMAFTMRRAAACVATNGPKLVPW